MAFLIKNQKMIPIICLFYKLFQLFVYFINNSPNN